MLCFAIFSFSLLLGTLVFSFLLFTTNNPRSKRMLAWSTYAGEFALRIRLLLLLLLQFFLLCFLFLQNLLHFLSIDQDIKINKNNRDREILISYLLNNKVYDQREICVVRVVALIFVLSFSVEVVEMVKIKV